MTNTRIEWADTESGLIVPEHCLRKRPIAIDLFAGCGGFSLGFIQGGFDVIAALECEPAAVVTYLYNLGAYPVKMIFIEQEDRERMEEYLAKVYKRIMKGKDLIGDVLVSGGNRHIPGYQGVRYMFVGDARKITGQQILDVIGLQPGEVDCVIGGPPCQGFTRLNTRRNVMDPRNSLVFDFMRLVCEIRPKMFAMENVPGIVDMVTPEGIPVIDALCRIAEDGGFGPFEAIKKTLLSTAGCGVAFKSKRIISSKNQESEQMRLIP